jgi:hypothetical protein
LKPTYRTREIQKKKATFLTDTRAALCPNKNVLYECIYGSMNKRKQEERRPWPVFYATDWLIFGMSPGLGGKRLREEKVQKRGEERQG